MWRSIVGLCTIVGLLLPAPGLTQETSIPHYEGSLTGRDTAQADDLASRANAAEEADRFDEVVRLHEAMLELRTRVLGKDHSHTVWERWDLDRVRKVAALSPEKRAGWRSAIDGQIVAGQLKSQGEVAAAEQLCRKALQWQRNVLGEKHPFTAGSYRALAGILDAQGRFAEALLLAQKALDINLELLGEKDPTTAMSMNNVAVSLCAQGKYSEAQVLFQKSLDVQPGLFGERKPSIAIRYSNLASVLTAQGKYVEAQSIFQEAIDRLETTPGKSRIHIAMGYAGLASNLSAQGRHAEAQQLYQKALHLNLELRGENHPSTARSYNGLAHSLSSQEKYIEAQPLFQKALDLDLRLLGQKHPDVALGFGNLATCFNAQQKYAEAEGLYRKALDLRLELLGANHPDTAADYYRLAVNQIAQERYAEARECLLKAAVGYEAVRLNVAVAGLDRAVFGAEQSPYGLLAAVHAILDSPTPAWVAAESNLARGLSDELASRRGVALSVDEKGEKVSFTRELAELETHILRLVAKQELSDSETDELARLQLRRRAAETQLVDRVVALSKREVASLTLVQSVIPENAALVFWVDASSRWGGVDEHWGCVVRSTGEPAWERIFGTGPQNEWKDQDRVLPGKLRQALASETPLSEIKILIEELRTARGSPGRSSSWRQATIRGCRGRHGWRSS